MSLYIYKKIAVLNGAPLDNFIRILWPNIEILDAADLNSDFPAAAHFSSLPAGPTLKHLHSSLPIAPLYQEI